MFMISEDVQDEVLWIKLRRRRSEKEVKRRVGRYFMRTDASAFLTLGKDEVFL